MIEFQLFRIKVYPVHQRNLFINDMTRPEILKSVIQSLPEFELRTGSVWHIGNISNIDQNALYFRLGRTTTSTVELYQDHNFLERPFELAPYTHVIFDIELEIAAIANKSRLSPKVRGIANSFVELLNKSQEAVRINASFEVGEIYDPQTFIEQLHVAHAISKFWVTFSRPNPWDIDQEFVAPMQNYLTQTNAKEGKTEIKGEILNPERLQEISRSAAATGNNAGAVLQLTSDGQKIKKNLRQNPILIQQENIADQDDKRTLLDRIRNLYQRIRGRNVN